MKYKYEDFCRIMKQLDRHSQKGDIHIHFDERSQAIVFDYVSNVGTETIITVFPSEINTFTTITEKKWLKD